MSIAGRRAQVKVAANGFKSLYAALEGVEMVFLRADRRPWLAVLPAESLFALLARGGVPAHPKTPSTEEKQ